MSASEELDLIVRALWRILRYSGNLAAVDCPRTRGIHEGPWYFFVTSWSQSSRFPLILSQWFNPSQFWSCHFSQYLSLSISLIASGFCYCGLPPCSYFSSMFWIYSVLLPLFPYSMGLAFLLHVPSGDPGLVLCHS